MTTNNADLKLLTAIQNSFPLEPSEVLRILSYIGAGSTIVAAGVSYWHIKGGELKRVTVQLPLPGLGLITDDSFLYQELMADLCCVEEQMLNDGIEPKDFDKCLYVITLSKADPKQGTYPKTFPHFFARSNVPADQELQ